MRLSESEESLKSKSPLGFSALRDFVRLLFGAEGETRTPTPERELAPESECLLPSSAPGLKKQGIA